MLERSENGRVRQLRWNGNDLRCNMPSETWWSSDANRQLTSNSSPGRSGGLLMTSLQPWVPQGMKLCAGCEFFGPCKRSAGLVTTGSMELKGREHLAQRDHGSLLSDRILDLVSIPSVL